MLCQIPGVSHNSAHSIMTRYSNLYELITNLTKQLIYNYNNEEI